MSINVITNYSSKIFLALICIIIDKKYIDLSLLKVIII